MKLIREVDIVEYRPEPCCKICQRKPKQQSTAVWTQVGFSFICDACS